MTPAAGEIWQVDFGPPVPRRAALVRPALVIAPLDTREWPGHNVAVVPLTTTDRGRPSDVALTPDELSGLASRSLAQCEYVTSLPITVFARRLGTVHPDDWQRISWIVGSFLGYL